MERHWQQSGANEADVMRCSGGKSGWGRAQEDRRDTTLGTQVSDRAM